MVYLMPSKDNCKHCLGLDPPTYVSSAVDKAKALGLISLGSNEGDDDGLGSEDPSTSTSENRIVSSGTQFTPDQSKRVVNTVNEAIAADTTPPSHVSAKDTDAAIGQATAELDVMYIGTPNVVALPPSDGDTPGNTTLSPSSLRASIPTEETHSPRRHLEACYRETPNPTRASDGIPFSKYAFFGDDEKTEESGAQEKTDLQFQRHLGDKEQDKGGSTPDEPDAHIRTPAPAPAQRFADAPIAMTPEPFRAAINKLPIQPQRAFNPALQGRKSPPRRPRDKVNAATPTHPAPPGRHDGVVFARDDEQTESTAGTGATGATGSTAATDVAESNRGAAEEEEKGKRRGKKDG